MRIAKLLTIRLWHEREKPCCLPQMLSNDETVWWKKLIYLTLFSKAKLNESSKEKYRKAPKKTIGGSAFRDRTAHKYILHRHLISTPSKYRKTQKRHLRNNTIAPDQTQIAQVLLRSSGKRNKASLQSKTEVAKRQIGGQWSWLL